MKRNPRARFNAATKLASTLYNSVTEVGDVAGGIVCSVLPLGASEVGDVAGGIVCSVLPLGASVW